MNNRVKDLEKHFNFIKFLQFFSKSILQCGNENFEKVGGIFHDHVRHENNFVTLHNWVVKFIPKMA